MNIIFTILVWCLHESTANRFSMPVMVVDAEHVLYGISINTNPFHKMSPPTFSDIIRDAIHRSERIILFIEDHFSVEDISTKDELGTPYYYLHQGIIDHKTKYIPSVVEPFKTIKHMFPPLESNVFYLSDTLQSFDSNFKYYYVFFQDQWSNETRVEKLRRHDKIMRTVYKLVRQVSPGPVVSFYTGKANPMMSMGKVAYLPQEPPAEEPEEGPVNLMIVTEGALFRLSGVYSTGGMPRTMQSAPTVSEQVMTHRRLMTRMLYSDFELEFNFQYEPDGWILDDVALLEGGEEVGCTKIGAGAPWDWSYYCAEPLVIVNTRDLSAVVIATYQVEPLINSYYGSEFLRGGGDGRRQNEPDPATSAATPSDDGKADFTNTKNCGPYFNAHILAGLMVAGLVLVITMYGVVTMHSCNTNSRYDDPNSKPLVIVAQL